MPRIDDFLGLYSKKSTRRGYKTSLRHFFDVVFKLERIEDDAHYEDLADRYFQELEKGKRTIETDVLTFAAALSDYAPITSRARMAAVKEFLIHSGYDLSPQTIRGIRREIPKGFAQTEEIDMDREIIQKILQHCDLRGRAIFLVLISSGMRVGELLCIQKEDIDFNKTPVEIRVRKEYTKTRTKRTAFMSQEATDAVQAWLKVRDAHLASSENRNKGLIAHGLSATKKINDQRLFPYEYSTVDKIFENAVRKAGLFSKDDTTNRKQLHIHQFRKYFRTNAATKIPVDLAEALMGHAGYLTRSYRKYTREQLGQYYQKAEPALTVFTQEDLETRAKVTALTQENEMLKQRLSSIELQLKADVQTVTKRTDQKFIEIAQDPKQIQELMAILKEIAAKQNA